MKKVAIAVGALAGLLVVVALVLAAVRKVREAREEPASADVAPQPAPAGGAGRAAGADPQGFLYGRVTTRVGTVYQGRLRWGGGEEAFWGDYFNGQKNANVWTSYVAPERLPKERHAISFMGLEISASEKPRDLDRLFMARFGDLARVEARGREIHVTLKSGSDFVLNGYAATDFDDGVRVWDEKQGVVDLDSLEIRLIELLPTPALADLPPRLHGTVRSRGGEFTGFVQWDRTLSLGSDELRGKAGEGTTRFRFDSVRSLDRRDRSGAVATLREGGEIPLARRGDNQAGSWGVYVDDRRYGRVLVSWEAFERLDLDSGPESGPAYGDFPPGSPLAGEVTLRDGRRFAGRLVYDLDESESTETLDAPRQGIDYTILFGLIASIVPPVADGAGEVTLHSGEKLELERDGDLGDGNAGLLVFVDGIQNPEYVPWGDVARIDLSPPSAMFPPLAAR